MEDYKEKVRIMDCQLSQSAAALAVIEAKRRQEPRSSSTSALAPPMGGCERSQGERKSGRFEKARKVAQLVPVNI